jgi:hypothetical protein
MDLSSIRLDGGTQCRVSLDADHIASLVEAFQSDVKIPPVVVFNDGCDCWLADGFHRYHAAQTAGLSELAADVRSGTRMDAVKFALGANTVAGVLRRRNADKRRCVEIALKEFSDLSDRQIAELCAVGNQMVGTVRAQLCESHSSPTPAIPATPTPTTEPPESAPPPAPVTRLGADGRRRKVKKEKHTPIPLGMQVARGAILHLQKITNHDSERITALTMVRDWCNKQLSL